jgi:hypothetical protein
MFLFQMKSDLVLEHLISYLNDTTNLNDAAGQHVLNVTLKQAIEINAWLKYC